MLPFPVKSTFFVGFQEHVKHSIEIKLNFFDIARHEVNTVKRKKILKCLIKPMQIPWMSFYILIYRAVTRALIEGGVHSYIRVLRDKFVLKSVDIRADFKTNSSGRTRIYEYTPTHLPLVTPLLIDSHISIFSKWSK